MWYLTSSCGVIGGQEPEFNWDSELPPEERSSSGSAPAYGNGGSSGGATAEPPISPANDFSPLPPSNQPTTEQRAAENFGQEAPF